MYNAQSLVQNIKQQAKQKNILIGDMLLACELNINTLSQISDKKGLSSFSLARIADYLDCSVDYLLGRTNEPTNTHYINNDINNGNIMQDIAVVDSAIHFVSDKDKGLSKEESEILDIYRSFNICDKSTFLNFILGMRKEKSC